MAKTDKTPLWLDLRKEYIDDNFEKLRSYLLECSTNASKKDSFFDTTIELLRARVEDLIAAIASRPIFAEEVDRNSGMYNGFSHRLHRVCGILSTIRLDVERISSLLELLDY